MQVPDADGAGLDNVQSRALEQTDYLSGADMAVRSMKMSKKPRLPIGTRKIDDENPAARFQHTAYLANAGFQHLSRKMVKHDGLAPHRTARRKTATPRWIRF